jgi:biopolymer transport protein ExbD
MRLPEEPDNPPQIYLAPMIDVVFSILTFFIMSSLYLSRSQGLPVALPQAATAESQKLAQINVTVNQKGEVALNKRPIPLDGLAPQIQNLLRQNRKSVVVVNADERVSHGRVIAVMDRLRAIPGVRLAIATRP